MSIGIMTLRTVAGMGFVADGRLCLYTSYTKSTVMVWILYYMPATTTCQWILGHRICSLVCNLLRNQCIDITLGTWPAVYCFLPGSSLPNPLQHRRWQQLPLNILATRRLPSCQDESRFVIMMSLEPPHVTEPLSHSPQWRRDKPYTLVVRVSDTKTAVNPACRPIHPPTPNGHPASPSSRSASPADHYRSRRSRYRSRR